MPSLSPGSLVSHYRIVSLLGTGGMGEVYRAVDSNLSRPVALKILSQQFIRSDEAVQRFIQEARAASALNHPNIVTVYDIGKVQMTVDGSDEPRLIHYIAMELIEGHTLRSLIAREELSLRQRVDALSQVAAGLAKAHAAHIVHRDLKPDNVMLTEDGYAKVLDFGLAKLTEKQRAHDGSTSRQLTAVGAVLGTIGYMSPEQVEQKPVDHRSDVFSFGCVGFHALTGRGPFDRGSLIDTLHAIVHTDPPPLADIVPDAPAALVDIIERCLAKDPAQRPQSMREVATQLQDIARATDPNSLIVLPRAKRRSLAPAMSAAAAVIAIGAVISFAVYRQRQPAPFDAMRITRVASSGRSTVAAISPDGKYLSYSVDEAGKQSLWIRQIASGSDIRVVPLADVHFVGCAFSPDGNYLYYVSAENKTDRASIYRVPVIGGTAQMVVDDLHARIAISPDGQRFAYAQTDRGSGRSFIATRKVDGTDERIVAVRKLPETYTAVTWSPDGESLGYSYVTYGGGYHAVVGTIKLVNRSASIIESPKWSIVDSIAWLPDDELVVNAKDSTDTRNQLWLLPQRGRARRITNDLSDYESAALTADGTKLVTLQKNQSSSIWTASGGAAASARQIVRAQDNLDGMWGLAALRDGRIVYSSSMNDARNLWIVDADGANSRRLTDGGSDILPATSMDGRTVVFMSMRNNGRSNIWRLDVPSGTVTQLTTGDFESSPSISPDGSWVAFHSNQSGVRTIWRVPATGGPPQQVTTSASSWPSISPDGSAIACSWFDRASGRIVIAVVPSQGGEPTEILDIPVNAWMGANNHHVRWRADDLTYVDNKDGVSNIWAQPLDRSSPPRQLTRFTEGHIFYFDWTANGRDLVLARGQVSSNVVMIDGFR